MNNLKEFHFRSKLKEAVHIYLASQIVTYEEIKEIQNTFEKIDKDGDGKITKEELLEEYKKFMKVDEADTLADKIMENLDQDQDGNIDFTEFLISSKKTRKSISYEQLEIAFKMFDIDGDGCITANEIKAILGDGQLAEDATWVELLKEADSNGDGCIDIKEFLLFMNSTKNIDFFS